MILELDIGNTFVKWRLLTLDDRQIVLRGKFFSKPTFSTQSLPSNDQVRKVKVSSVANSDYDAKVASDLHHKYGVEPIFAVTQKKFRHLQVAYDKPLKLGVDRWLAMLAASNRASGVIVISFGSAIFADVVSADGVHLGGFIIPGIRMMQESLLHGTHEVDIDVQNAHQYHDFSLQAQLGDNTQHCVIGGIFTLLASWIKGIEQTYTEDFDVFVTGGDANLCLGMFQGAVIHDPELVLNGLEFI